MDTLRWVRTFGDVVFIVGALAVAWQVIKALFVRDFPVVETVGKITAEKAAAMETSLQARTGLG